MPTEAENALTLVGRLYTELQRRRPNIRLYSDYYDGKHPLAFATDQFRRYWGGLFDAFADNWCQVVVDSKAERLKAIGVADDKGQPDTDIWRVWQTNGFDADSGLAFVDSLAESRSFAMVWGNPDDTKTPIVTFESAREVIVCYEPGSRRRRKAALKVWCDEDANKEFATLILPDKVWKFERPYSRILAEAAELVARSVEAAGIALPIDNSGGGWVLRNTRDTGDRANPQRNPMGVVSVVELPNRSRLATEPKSEIKNVIPMQDTVNLLWSHTLTASDFAAFSQKVILGMDAPQKPIVNDAGEVVGYEPADLAKFAVDRVVWLEDPNAKIAEWSASDLSNYTSVIEIAVGHIAAQTRTPQHYLIGKMANLSAEALKAAETGLVSSVREKQTYLGEALREIARLTALAQGDKGKAARFVNGRVLWQDPESRSDAEKAASLVQLKGLNVPDEMLWQLYGFTPTQINNMKEMQSAAASRAGVSLATFLNGPEPTEPQPSEEPPTDEAA